MFGRSPQRVLSALLNKKNYSSVCKAPLVYADVYESFFQGYVQQKGSYPQRVRLKTPLGIHSVEVLNSLDMFTVHEIFVWEIYYANKDAKVVVDFGSNIGISQAYFLTRNPQNVVYGFEPVPHLYSQLSKNSAKFEGRAFNSQVAVSSDEGMSDMGIESSGRYGGIGLALESTIQVKTVSAQAEIAKVLAQHEYIDILKIDIEGLEESVINALSDESLARIKTIYVEAGDDVLFFPDRLKKDFTLSSSTGICKYTNRSFA
jgi:FkbM family methyltransferase